jgi:hypothetical protein
MENRLQASSIFSSIPLQSNQTTVTMQSTNTQGRQELTKKKIYQKRFTQTTTH